MKKTSSKYFMGNRRNLSSFDFNSMDLSDYPDELAPQFSRMNSITRRFFKAESIIPFRMHSSPKITVMKEASKEKLKSNPVNENIPKILDKIRKEYIHKISLFKLDQNNNINSKQHISHKLNRDLLLNDGFDPYDYYGPRVKMKRKIVEPTMVEKQTVISQEETQMLFYSKLIDMSMKYSEVQNERFQRYIEQNSYNGKLKL